MSFRLRHDWATGAVLPRVVAAHPPLLERPPAALSSCRACGVLRVIEGEREAYVRRRADAERVTAVEPPCVSTDAPFRAPW